MALKKKTTNNMKDHFGHMNTDWKSNPHQPKDKPVRVAVAEFSVQLHGQLLLVDVLLKDAGSSYRVGLNR